MLILESCHWQTIMNHARATAPLEACGILAGIREDDVRRVQQVYLLTNIDGSPEHFSMDLKEQFAVLKDIRRHAWVMLANFHSHPVTPARPSEEDRRLAFDPELSYVIISLQEPSRPIAKSFRIRNQDFEEEIVFIQEDSGGETGSCLS